MIIQGGMGIGVSNWILARAVAQKGHLGVVSGTCVDSLLVRRLQDGDLGGHVRRAMEAFPIPEISAAVLEKYFIPGGKSPETPYRLLSMWKQKVNLVREQIAVLSSFVEVYLAKEGHEGPVGINLLTKVQMPNLPTLYGAMLAEVDYVLMGAGIPREIPGVLDAFSEHRTAVMRLDVEGPRGEGSDDLVFDPATMWGGATPIPLSRPKFLPIIASSSLARMLAKKSTGRVDGWIIEGPTAGGHNAPPRGRPEVGPTGEPVYGERDEVNLDEIAELGLPFWLAGGTGSPDGLKAALEAGAAGIQVGTLFAYTDESGIAPELKERTLRQAGTTGLKVKTDLRASPTGFPFKVVQMEGTNSGREAYEARTRVCDLGYLRSAYRMENGRVGYRCAAEPVDTYVAKGGTLEETVDRKCLCNALMADVGHPQARLEGRDVERPILTSGDDLERIGEFLEGRISYTAADVLDYLMSGLPNPQLAEVMLPVAEEVSVG
jgi:nitronate monooxygenase